MEEERHSFWENKGSFLIDRKEIVVHGPTALEKPLTDCISRTQPLLCIAEEWSWKSGRNFLLVSGLCLIPVILNLGVAAAFKRTGFTRCLLIGAAFYIMLICIYVDSRLYNFHSSCAIANRQEFTCSGHIFSFPFTVSRWIRMWLCACIQAQITAVPKGE